MELIEDKQKRLIVIKNLCSNFSVAVEKYYSKPNAQELIDAITKLHKECEDYLITCQP